LSWYEQRSPHTKAYDEYLLKQLVNSTIEDVSLKRTSATMPLWVPQSAGRVEINWAEVED
jgi:hypothetical protein